MISIYNEIDEYASRWIDNLITAGHVTPGIVDSRSIAELTAEDVRHARQAHFFAGIAVWSAAARAAGWPDNAELWTGSCPCQPFSQAGSGKGTDDARHLWPEWFRLIRECRPPVVVGEQVASPAGLGWLDAVFADLESAGYACAAIDFGAASVGAPHQRQRLYFVAVADGERLEELRVQLRERRPRQAVSQTGGCGEISHVADNTGARREERRDSRSSIGAGPIDDSASGSLADAECHNRTRRIDQSHGRSPIESDRHGAASGAGATENADESHALHGNQPRSWRLVQPPTHATDGFWSPADWIPCTDGKARPVEPGTFPLAHGATARVGRLRAYGNAIVRPQAQAFLEVVINMLATTRGSLNGISQIDMP